MSFPYLNIVFQAYVKNKECEFVIATYNREAAVAYAKRWWNDANPAYPFFEVDCTNFVSQCLRAGGATMYGYPNRSAGWWLQGDTWSFSWSVAHSLRWFMETSKQGLRAVRVMSPSELQIGDVIFYDFTADGRIDHSTIVTTMYNGVPYIHAHTSNSENRHYSYNNSTAYSPNIRYYFFHITEV